MIDSDLATTDKLETGTSVVVPSIGLRTFVVAIGFAVMLSALYFAVKPLAMQMLPVRFVRIYGALERVRKNQIQSTLESLVDKGYWSVDLEAIQVATESLPWVERAQINRVWPDTLMLGIIEQVPYVRWGKTALLNTNGDRFVPHSTAGFQNLPVIFGPSGKEAQLVKVFKDLQKRLAVQQLDIRVLNVSDRLSWSVRLQGGLDVAIGRRDPVAVFDRFIKTLPLLGPDQIRAMRRVDLRYPNGYAVDWKPGVELEWRPVSQRASRTIDNRVRSI